MDGFGGSRKIRVFGVPLPARVTRFMPLRESGRTESAKRDELNRRREGSLELNWPTERASERASERERRGRMKGKSMGMRRILAQRRDQSHKIGRYLFLSVSPRRASLHG
jgi:hypothetical protein